jgi:hypothetical protein
LGSGARRKNGRASELSTAAEQRLWMKKAKPLVALKALEPFIRNGEPLQTGKPEEL